MRFLDLILKKRDGESLSAEEISFIIQEYNKENIPDYQMSALLMAIFFQGLNNKETSAFTAALAESGEVLDFSSLGKIVADKHSSGGVGDKVTLVLAPLVAAAEVPVAKISGRGLGFTGGTIDKLESIPGFSANLTIKRFSELVSQNNLAIMAQTDRLTPAEGKLYALRDVTGTIENISLIAASIMSKKIAAGAGAILLDVKTGRGAFMQSKEKAFHLAETMVRIGKEMGKRVVSVVTDMSQPLGFAVGNILEVKEALSVLKGEGPQEVEQLCLFLGGLILALVGKVRDPEEGQEELARLLKSGVALEKFKQMVAFQGGKLEYLENTDLFPKASYIEPIKAPKSGYLREIDALRVGRVAVLLGAGRSVKGEKIDPSVGVLLTHKVGDSVEEGEILAFLHGNKEDTLSASVKELTNAFLIVDERVEPPPLIHGVVPPFPS
ncbi:MAG: thymidine phosphorylase [Firmicutes bacterium]|nr:thymidine phosphorylase [Bacillota bacterium]